MIMARVSIFGGKVYNDPAYKNFINNFYHPLENMKRSVEVLKAASDRIDIATMDFGDYQPILAPLATWPEGKGKRWWREMGQARIDLSAQLNDLPLSLDEPYVPT